MKNISFGPTGYADSKVQIANGSSPTCVVTTVLHQFSESLGNAVDAKDSHTRQHSEEVAQVAHTLALGMGLSTGHADVIHVAGHLHDIGKIGIPDAILFKQKKLSTKEFEIIKKHSAIGASIVSPVSELTTTGITAIILHHHERYDGTGYPAGLKGEDIPIGARVVAVADSLSAMLQDRPYNRAMSFAEASQEIARMSGSQFDPAVVRSFIKNGPLIKTLLQVLKQN